ncbi:MAG: cobalamin-binding protein [Firmicutes bacterium]|nr:cobalamin-binding protein [Bacillota bacterium]
MKKTCLVFVLVLVMLAAVGCSQSAEKEAEGPFVTLVDQTGREVVIEKKPETIISVSPGNTEIAFALGLDDLIIGVTDYCNYPEAALAKEKIGGFTTPNVEKIVDLKPDLVFCGNMHEELAAQLEELGLTVITLAPKTMEEMYEAVELAGKATGYEDKAAELVANMQSRIAAVQEKLSAITENERVRVYYEVYSEPLMTAGGASLINEVIKHAGGINIFADLNEDYPMVSEEMVLTRDPEFILYPLFHGSEELNIPGRPAWQGVTAIKNENVHGVTDDSTSRPGPRLVDAVEEMFCVFYPDLN